MKLAAACLALAVCCTSAQAADMRLRRINFNPDAVVTLNVPIGIAMHVVLQPGEEYVTHALGDPGGWDFMQNGNHYFLKPKAANADTNLVIVTSKRTYNFMLHVGGGSVLQLTFGYPGDDARARAAAATTDRFKARAGAYNLSYTESATVVDQDITPVNVWDDGLFTYFKFADNTDIPNVYTVSADGSEALVNRHMFAANGRVIVAEKIAPKFVLRLGDAVVGIYNDAYSRGGTPNTTRTSVPTVQRVLKGDE